MIRTEGLNKYYGSRCAVRNLTVAIEDREIVGFLGLNGAGKTTTLRMLAGMLLPSSGRIEIDGKNMLDAHGAELRWRIGFLPERPPVYEEMTVRDYLDFAARLRGYDANKVQGRVAEVLKLTDLEAYADEPIANLSHGYRQRCGIAQAVVHDPDLVILDEPISGLDPVQIVEMRRLIRSLKSQHTVLLSSHNLPEISQTCDRLLVIRGGELVATGSEAELNATAGKGSRFVLELSGDGGTVDARLREIQGRGVISAFKRAERVGVHEVEATLGDHAPEALAKAIVEAGLGLRRMQPRANELESLFLELTKKAS